ncbi:exonuclease [Gordonia phage Rabbitrun]|uniref:Exonuclease n=1 Tax=Gordonia phage Rabbitrun TaxID=2762280 RepID=A0A7G8LIM9_9CAUD|nr:exonuclease [Gordonia phage Rabbitrun]QNJ57101.1 exonuclease [Gordonia phage Rabbitrun]
MPPGAGPLTGEPKTGKARNGKPKTWWISRDATPYARMSGIAKPLDSKEGLVDWAAAQAAVGVMLDEAARSKIVTLINEYDADPWNNGDDGSFKSGKSRLKEAVEQARTTAGQNVASAAGTEFHTLGELHNRGKTPRIVQEHLVPLYEHYKERVAPLKFLNQELFVVNDELQLAGSLDYLIELPDGRVVVGDLKTGKWDFKYPMSCTTQIAGYANSVVYDQATGIRTPIHPDLDTSVGLLVHFPIKTKNPKVRFYELDLELGMRAARIAGELSELQREFKRKGAEPRPIEFV